MTQILKPLETSCLCKWGGRFSLLSGYPNSWGGETHTVISSPHGQPLSSTLWQHLLFFLEKQWQSWSVSISDPSPVSGFWQRRSNLLVEINSIFCIFYHQNKYSLCRFLGTVLIILVAWAVTYRLFTNEWFSAWGTGGNFSLQSQVKEGIYILKHTNVTQPRTLPVWLLGKYKW